MYYVLHPEEPGLHIMVNGRILRFVDGRLSTERDQLTQGDLEWFAQRSPRFIVTSDLSDPALRVLLSERLIPAMGNLADARDFAHVMTNVNYTLAMMLSASGVAVERTPFGISQLKGLFQPGSTEAKEVDAAATAAREEADDAAAIAAGLAEAPNPDELVPTIPNPAFGYDER